MKVGDLVKYSWPDSFNDYARITGIVVESRSAHKEFVSCNLEVVVHWEDGTIETFDELEVEIIKVIK